MTAGGLAVLYRFRGVGPWRPLSESGPADEVPHTVVTDLTMLGSREGSSSKVGIHPTAAEEWQGAELFRRPSLVQKRQMRIVMLLPKM